ncbi:UBP1-associated protein 2A-like [Salvia miltiorrhiza]|uniref:UBP1-associated protein 2A-like n=1 Tax=Salvia miltiorrhiza TaxID=226208 RepID=UPI0025AB8983|nr:UBP1-associated protein 2A-like [Salvia miltiorrhiza]
MAKKRKLEAGPPQIEKEEEIVVEEEDLEEIIDNDDEEEIEYEEVEYEEEEEEEADVEVDDPRNNNSVGEKPILSKNVGGDASTIPTNNNNGGEVEEEPIHSVLAAFSKEKLVELLAEAAHRHVDLAARVWASADVDPSQRKIFVHGLNWDTAEETLLKEFAKHGEIEECRLITDKITGQSKGYGSVFFRTCRAARQALKEPQKLIDR